MNNKKIDYARVVYNQKSIPLTSYPKKLVKHLIRKFHLKDGSSLLELGPARGDFLVEFLKENFKISAVDISDYVKELCPNIDFKNANLESEKIPFDDNSFDIVYTKSFVEHFYHPEKIFKEIFRVLKPGGVFTMRTLGEHVGAVLKLSRELGFIVSKNERQGYEEDYKDDWVDIILTKRVK